MKIKLSKWIVELRDDLGWYEMEEIKASMINGSKLNPATQEIGISGTGMFEARIRLAELAIVSIKNKEGDTDVVFSRDWLKQLGKEDGEMLFSALDSYEAKKA